MSSTETLKLTRMAHGAKAIAKANNQTIFVAGGLPNETVRARIVSQKGHSAEAEIVEILRASKERVEPRCQPADIPIADYQHISYKAQLQFKEQIVVDQLQRVGGMTKISADPIVPHPQIWGYRMLTTLSKTDDNRLGYWSRGQRKVVPAPSCPVLHPTLQNALRDIDLELEDLIKLHVRVGSDDTILLAFEMRDAEPPLIEIDFPVSVALVMPDGVAATLIGDSYLVQRIAGHDYRVSPGSHFHVSPDSAELVTTAVSDLAMLYGDELGIDCYSGVGVLTNALSIFAKEVIGIEVNADAVEDAAINLDHTNNVALYNDWVETALPAIGRTADILVLDCDENGLSNEAGFAIVNHGAPRIVYSNPNISTMARDARNFEGAGYEMVRIRPIDTLPQTFQIHTVSVWRKIK
jgi:23S rRNA (uracil1939-C5)-methyltransferase